MLNRPLVFLPMLCMPYIQGKTHKFYFLMHLKQNYQIGKLIVCLKSKRKELLQQLKQNYLFSFNFEFNNESGNEALFRLLFL